MDRTANKIVLKQPKVLFKRSFLVVNENLRLRIKTKKKVIKRVITIALPALSRTHDLTIGQ